MNMGALRKSLLSSSIKNTLMSTGSAAAFLAASSSTLADTDWEVGGYVKLDAIFDADADVGDSFVFSSIPREGSVADERDTNVRLHARQSRLWIKTSTETKKGPLKTHIQGDFFGGGGNQSLSNSSSFRIRHAYLETDHWLFGQTWSNFMTLHAYPETVDFFGPVGIPFVRQGQIRYTFKSGENTTVSFSVENPETDGTDSTGALVRESGGGIGKDEFPDITFAWQKSMGGVTIRTMAVVRDLAVDDGLPAGIDDSESGVGVGFSGTGNIGNDSLGGYIYAGDGIGRYLINGVGKDLHVDLATRKVETLDAMGGGFSYTHAWTPKARTNVVIGFYEVDDAEDFAGLLGGFDELRSLHVNLMWEPWENTTLGFELIRGEIDFVDGTDNDATRFQFGAQRNFGFGS